MKRASIIITLIILCSIFLPTNKVVAINNIPTSYILLKSSNTDIKVKQYGNIDVKFGGQQSENESWEFSAIKSLETNLALRGVNIDLSENHLNYLTSTEFGGERKLGEQGSFDVFKKYLKTMYGPVLEGDAPYGEKFNKLDYNYLLELSQVAFVNQTVDFKPIYKDNAHSITNTEITEFRNSIKQHIINNGSVYAVVANPEDSINYYNTNTHAECYLEDMGMLHLDDGYAVSIIGWDDNYSKYNFLEENRPQSNGAYIALDSNANSTNNGIFYISYEDKIVETNMHGVVNANTTGVDYETVVFQDENLYNTMKASIPNKIAQFDDRNKTINIYKYAIDLVKKVDLSNKNITNLTGLEKFSIEKLDLSNNNITDITPIRNLINTKSLNLANNHITNVEILKNFNNLKELDLSGNGIEEISGVKGLDKLTSLETLKLGYNHIMDLSGISNLVNLKEIHLDNNELIDIIELEDLPNLESLNLSGNNIESIYDLAGVEELNLKELNLSNNNITQLYGIDYFKSLNSLNVSNNNISDIKILQNLPNIQELDISGNNINNIANVTSVTNLKNLKTLKIANSKINNLAPIAELKNLYNLDVSNNQITNISVLENWTDMGILNLSNNNISDITPLQEFKNIENLDLSNNNITNIQVLNYLHTEENLDLRNNNIEDYTVVETNPYLCGIKFTASNVEENKKIARGVESKITLPHIMNIAFKQGVYGDVAKFDCKNCSISSDATKLIIKKDNIENGQASITINGGSFNGYTYTLNYNVVEKVNVTQLSVANEDEIQTLYVEGDKFNQNNLQVLATYESGEEELTNEYEIVNGRNNLLKSQNGIVIKSTRNTDVQYTLPITVYGKNEVNIINFDDENFYNAIKDKSAFAFGPSPYLPVVIECNEEKTLAILNDDIPKIVSMNLAGKNIKKLKGIEKFSNLNLLNLMGNNRLESVDELASLPRLQNVMMIDCKVPSLSKILVKDNIQNIYLSYTDNEVKQIKNDEYVLPQYIFELLILQNSTYKATVYYTTDMVENSNYAINPESEMQETTIKVDTTNRIATINLDTEINSNKKEEIRGIELFINGEKTRGALYTMFYNPKKVKDEEVKLESTKYKISDQYVERIQPSTTVEQFCKDINSNGELKVYDKNNEEVSGEKIVGTGMKLVGVNGTKTKEKIISVVGDLNGDGEITIKDIVKIKQYIRLKNLNGEYIKAGDVNYDNQINIKDLIKEKQYIRKTIKMF